MQEIKCRSMWVVSSIIVQIKVVYCCGLVQGRLRFRNIRGEDDTERILK